MSDSEPSYDGGDDFEPESPATRAVIERKSPSKRCRQGAILCCRHSLAFAVEIARSPSPPRVAEPPVPSITIEEVVQDSRAAEAAPPMLHSPVQVPESLTARSGRTPSGAPSAPDVVVLRSARGLAAVKAGSLAQSAAKSAKASASTAPGHLPMELSAAVVDAMGGRDFLKRLSRSAQGLCSRAHSACCRSAYLGS